MGQGIINLGGKIQSVYNFAKKYNPKIKKISAKNLLGPKYPLNPSMNINKLKKILKWLNLGHIKMNTKN